MSDKPLRVSYGEFVYESVPGWAPLPDGWEWNHVVGVAVDSQDRIFAYTQRVTQALRRRCKIVLYRRGM